jgi:hypothetical protein
VPEERRSSVILAVAHALAIHVGIAPRQVIHSPHCSRLGATSLVADDPADGPYVSDETLDAAQEGQSTNAATLGGRLARELVGGGLMMAITARS